MFKKAFTIIELLIALIIFGLGILVILQVLNHNVVLSKTISLRTKSTMLAKEGMELAFNLRDSNNLKLQERNCYSDCSNYDSDGTFNGKIFQSGKNYKIRLDSESYIPYVEELSNLEDAKIYNNFSNVKNTVDNSTVYTGLYYNYYTSTGDKTPFNRYINIEDVKGLGDDANGKILKINSISQYKHGGIEGEIILSSFLSDWK